MSSVAGSRSRSLVARSISVAISLAMGALGLVPLACHEPPGEPARPQPAATPSHSGGGLPDRDPALAHRLVEQGALLLDVRTESEFAEQHLPSAHNIPHTEVPARVDEIERLVGGDRSTPIVVYCRSGRRSALAKEALSQRGFSQVTNLGGIGDW